MDDTISRAAAINAVNTWFELYVVNRTTANAVSIQDMLRALPSAQTEIILCKDCKHRPTRDEDGWLDFPTERCPCQNEDDFYYSWMPKDDWFCGNAERKENE